MAGGNGTSKGKVSREVLQHLDANEDGTLGLYELAVAYKKMGVRSPVQHAYMTLLSADEDGNGVINTESEAAVLAAYLRQPNYDTLNKNPKQRTLG